MESKLEPIEYDDITKKKIEHDESMIVPIGNLKKKKKEKKKKEENGFMKSMKMAKNYLLVNKIILWLLLFGSIFALVAIYFYFQDPGLLEEDLGVGIWWLFIFGFVLCLIPAFVLVSFRLIMTVLYSFARVATKGDSYFNFLIFYMEASGKRIKYLLISIFILVAVNILVRPRASPLVTLWLSRIVTFFVLFFAGLLVVKLISLKVSTGFNERVFLEKAQPSVLDELVLRRIFRVPLDAIHRQFLNRIWKAELFQNSASASGAVDDPEITIDEIFDTEFGDLTEDDGDGEDDHADYDVLHHQDAKEYQKQILAMKVSKKKWESDPIRTQAIGFYIRATKLESLLRGVFISRGISLDKLENDKLAGTCAKLLFNEILIANGKHYRNMKKKNRIVVDEFDFKTFWEKFVSIQPQEKTESVGYEKAWMQLNPRNLPALKRDEIRWQIQKMFYERSNFIKTLSDSTRVIQSFETALICVMCLILVFPVLALFGVEVVELWIGLSSIALSFVFIFGNAAKQLFENIIFLFVVHPYNVGDMVKLIIDGQETMFFVRGMQLSYTTFERWNGAIVQMQNTRLSDGKTTIINVSASSNHSDTHEFVIDATVVNDEFVKTLRDEMNQWIEQRPESFVEIAISVRKVVEPLKAKIYIWAEHNYTNEDIGRTFRDQTDLIVKFTDTLMKLGATFSGIGLGSMPKPPATTAIPVQDHDHDNNNNNNNTVLVKVETLERILEILSNQKKKEKQQDDDDLLAL